VKPPVEKVFAIFKEPDLATATEAEIQAHRREIVAALNRDERVFVVTPRADELRYARTEISYFKTDWEAGLAELSERPSRMGRQSALHDLCEDVAGNIVGVAPGAERAR
jgi:hypothetical protein